MKIYFIGQKGIPAKMGGVEKHVEELSVRLAEAGHEVYAYVRPNYTDISLREYRGVNLISLKSISTKHLDAITHTLRATFDVLRKDADIIHYHSIGPSSLLWLIKILKPRTPVISTFHAKCYTHKKWGWIARAYLRLGEWVSCVIADETIVVSETLSFYVKKTYGKTPSYIPNGVSLPELKEAEEIKKWGIKKDSYILTVSRLVRHKGIHYLIEAYNRLKTDKKLVIVGEGSFTDDYVKELSRVAGNNKNIIFTGSQTGRTLEELYSNAYLFVQPSESEGLSIALLEAMSFKNTILVSDIEENLEASARTGLSFVSGNIDSLEERLCYALEHPDEISARKALGYDRVKKIYDWKYITDAVIKTYNDCLEEKEKSAVRARIKLVKKIAHFLF